LSQVFEHGVESWGTTTFTGTHRNSQPIAAVSFPQLFARRITNI